MELQSNLGSRMPWITNSSVYEEIFRTQSVSDGVLCLELQTRKPSTSWVEKKTEKKKKNPLPNNNISLPHHLPVTPSTLLHTGTVKLNFRTQSTLDDLLCLELRTRKPSTSWEKKTEKRKRIPFQTITFHFLTAFQLRRQLSSIPVR